MARSLSTQTTANSMRYMYRTTLVLNPLPPSDSKKSLEASANNVFTGFAAHNEESAQEKDTTTTKTHTDTNNKVPDSCPRESNDLSPTASGRQVPPLANYVAKEMVTKPNPTTCGERKATSTNSSLTAKSYALHCSA